MRMRIVTLVFCAMLAGLPLLAQDSADPSDQPLTEAQKKIVAAAQKERRKYPLDLELLDSSVEGAPAPPVLYVGMCTGSLRWILCWDGNFKLGPDQRVVSRARWGASGDGFEISCPRGLGGKCAMLPAGIYPARRTWRVLAPSVTLVQILANVDGKMETVTFYFDGKLAGPAVARASK
jgi:hypothetical protein